MALLGRVAGEAGCVCWVAARIENCYITEKSTETSYLVAVSEQNSSENTDLG